MERVDSKTLQKLLHLVVALVIELILNEFGSPYFFAIVVLKSDAQTFVQNKYTACTALHCMNKSQ